MSIKKMVTAGTGDDYVKHLIKSGIKPLSWYYPGDGVVFNHPKMKNVVVKVAACAKKTGRSAAFEWLEWCKAHPNVWVPKVFEARLLDLDGPPWFIAFMEKLTPGKADHLEELIRKYDLEDVFVVERSHYNIKPAAIPAVKDAALRAALVGIAKAAQISDLDLSSSNIMYRGRQPVFVDPVV